MHISKPQRAVHRVSVRAVKADEIQVRGRVARKSDPGSYSLILSWVEIESVLGKSKELDKLRADAKIKYSSGADTAASEVYKQIDELRLSKANTIFEQQQIDAKKSEKVHAESMMLLADVRGYFNPSLQSLDPRSRDRERGAPPNAPRASPFVWQRARPNR